jgi:endonuclease/exonuclease/phosphatase family metal-dependent hydrolase
VTTTRLRVATWNVRGLRAGVAAVARAVTAERPDILLVQESGPRRRLRSLGAALGMAIAADPIVFPRRRIKNAVLVRPPVEIRSHRSVRFTNGSVLYPRGTVIARLDDDLSAVSMHLGLSGPERGRHVRQLLAFLEASPGRFVIGGDLNALPDDPGPSEIAAHATELWAASGEGTGATFPSGAPTARIDYLFAGAALRPLRAWTAGGQISDHLLVVADLEIGS